MLWVDKQGSKPSDHDAVISLTQKVCAGHCTRSWGHKNI